jgi:hypothetical protein
MRKKYCTAGRATDNKMVHASCVCIAETTDTHSDHVKRIAFPQH